MRYLYATDSYPHLSGVHAGTVEEVHFLTPPKSMKSKSRSPPPLPGRYRLSRIQSPAVPGRPVLPIDGRTLSGESRNMVGQACYPPLSALPKSGSAYHSFPFLHLERFFISAHFAAQPCGLWRIGVCFLVIMFTPVEAVGLLWGIVE